MLNVLWVDDELDKVRWQLGIIKAQVKGVRFRLASTIAVALRHLEKESFQIVITDGYLPVGKMSSKYSHTDFSVRMENTVPGFAFALMLAERNESLRELTQSLLCVVFSSAIAFGYRERVPNDLPIPLICLPLTLDTPDFVTEVLLRYQSKQTPVN